MRNDRPSLTAALVGGARALYSEMPEPYRTAPDAEAKKLLWLPLALPAMLLSRGRALGPLAHRLLGASMLGVTYHVALRTRAIDDALLEGLRDGATQVVLLGAGLDNRARRLPDLAEVRVFEVDHPAMQRWRRARLEGGATTVERDAASGSTDAAARSVPVPVDFERDDLGAALRDAGLSPARRTFWIWEGVTVYLTPSAIAGTLIEIAALSSPGSRLAMTYTRPDGLGSPAVVGLLQTLARVIDEPVLGMMTRDEVAERLTAVGLEPISDESALDWAPRYWGRDPPGLREWERLVVAERRPLANEAAAASPAR
jgi:methyltransferase (TIGR00027 family)